MDIVLENPKSLNPKVNIKLKTEDYQKNVDNTLKSYRKQVSLKGFRKGNAPMGMVKKMYGKQVVFDEINNMLSKALNDYIKEKELNILGEPLVDESALLGFDFDNPGDIDISYELGLIPEIKNNYKTGKISKHVVEVSNKTLDKMIEDLTIKHGTVEPSETLTEDGCVELQFIEMEKAGVEKENGLNTRKMILVKDINNKTIQNKILKFKLEQDIEVDIFKLFDSKEFIAQHILSVGIEKLEEISSKFKLVLKQISSVKKAKLDKSFFDMVIGPGKVKNEKEFKDHFRSQLLTNYGQMSDQIFFKDVTGSIIQNIKFELPDEFLKRWLIKTPQNKLTESDISENYDKYQLEIKEQIILDSILKENNIQIGSDEVRAKMDDQIRKTFYLPEDESIEDNEHLKTYRDNMINNKDYINYMFDQIRREKLTEVYNKKVKFTEKKIDSEEFMKLNK